MRYLKSVMHPYPSIEGQRKTSFLQSCFSIAFLSPDHDLSGATLGPNGLFKLLLISVALDIRTNPHSQPNIIHEDI